MIAYYKKTIHDKELKRLERFETGCWVNIVNPTEEEINFLVQRFGIERQNIISGLDENEVPRVEFDKDKVYIIVKTVYPKRPYL
jgi:magnesium transporter